MTCFLPYNEAYVIFSSRVRLKMTYASFNSSLRSIRHMKRKYVILDAVVRRPLYIIVCHFAHPGCTMHCTCAKKETPKYHTRQIGYFYFYHSLYGQKWRITWLITLNYRHSGLRYRIINGIVKLDHFITNRLKHYKIIINVFTDLLFRLQWWRRSRKPIKVLAKDLWHSLHY